MIAGGPEGEAVQITGGRVDLRGTAFAAQAAPLGAAGTSLVAVEPVKAIDALSERYRRFVFLAAAVTLLLAAALASKVARPLAQVVGDVARLTRQAHTDALTGLANRRALTARLEDELQRARRNGTSLSFVIADIDDFKPINDGFGHQLGDDVIKAVASALAGSVRETDLAVRFGGEEFVLVLPGARLANARRTADAIRTAIAELEVPNPGAVSRSASRQASGSRSSRPTRRRRRCSRRRMLPCTRRSGQARTGSPPRRCTTTSWATTPAPPASRPRSQPPRVGVPASSSSGWARCQSAALRKADATLPRDEIEPEQDHGRRSERAVELRRAADLRTQIQRHGEVNRLAPRATSSAPGTAGPPRVAPVGELSMIHSTEPR